jgi:large subunit ribosomal protein L24
MSVKQKLKKGDEVVVLTGRSKGQTGKVDQVVVKSGKVYITGVNLYKKHQKPGQGQNEGGIIEKPMPLPMSNVAFIDPKSKKPSKIGYKLADEGKTRIARASGSSI